MSTEHTLSDALFVPTYKRFSPQFVKGSGCYLFDTFGKKYLDFSTGIAVNALGHAHPRIIETIQSVAESGILHVSNLFHNPHQIELASKLIQHSFADRVFFCNSGTEANEAAIKFSRKKTGRSQILSFSGGFHGRTYGALSATPTEAFHRGFTPLVPGFSSIALDDRSTLAQLLQSKKFAAVLIEPIQGEGGIHPVDKNLLKDLRSLCSQTDTLLIFDEVQTGLGRTGELWAHQIHQVYPDIMTLSKPLGGGLPLGAVLTTEAVGSAIAPGDHGTTFGGNPLACALASQVIAIVSERAFLQQVQTVSDLLIGRLKEHIAGSKLFSAIRGNGLLIGLQCTQDPTEFIGNCIDKGLLLVKAAGNTVRFLPPLIITEQQVNEAISIVQNVDTKD